MHFPDPHRDTAARLRCPPAAADPLRPAQWVVPHHPPSSRFHVIRRLRGSMSSAVFAVPSIIRRLQSGGTHIIRRIIANVSASLAVLWPSGSGSSFGSCQIVYDYPQDPVLAGFGAGASWENFSWGDPIYDKISELCGARSAPYRVSQGAVCILAWDLVCTIRRMTDQAPGDLLFTLPDLPVPDGLAACFPLSVGAP